MSDLLTDRAKFSRAFLLLLVLLVSILFLSMIRNFLVAVFLGALTAALSRPLFHRFLRFLWGREAAAASVTVLVVFIIGIAPLLIIAGAVATQAVDLATSAGTWRSAHPDAVGELEAYLEQFPIYERIDAYRDVIVQKLGELAAALGSYLANALSAAARGTVGFILQLFLFLYATFYFLLNSEERLKEWARSFPLQEKQTRAIFDKFTSVARATFKGTIVAGILQGALIGIAFAFAGISGAVFWGAVMAVLSAIPVIGPSLVYVPTVIYLFAIGHIWAAIFLAIWSTVVCQIVNTFVRPRLVGRDTQMPDGLVLLGTLGGISMFGVVGLLVGPMIAALFNAVWDLYRSELRALLAEPVEQESGGGSG